MSAAEAEARIRAINEPYKLEILQGILAKDPNAPITIYHIGEQDHPMHWCAGRAGCGATRDALRGGVAVQCSTRQMGGRRCLA